MATGHLRTVLTLICVKEQIEPDQERSRLSCAREANVRSVGGRQRPGKLSVMLAAEAARYYHEQIEQASEI